MKYDSQQHKVNQRMKYNKLYFGQCFAWLFIDCCVLQLQIMETMDKVAVEIQAVYIFIKFSHTT